MFFGQINPMCTLNMQYLLSLSYPS
jgi:hypothetical protein